MMQQVQQMQQQMQQAQEELANETVTASAGGGAVKATMTGSMELVSIEIDPDVVDPEDVEGLQDLVIAAVNEAMASSQELANKKLGRHHGRPRGPRPEPAGALGVLWRPTRGR